MTVLVVCSHDPHSREGRGLLAPLHKKRGQIQMFLRRAKCKR